MIEKDTINFLIGGGGDEHTEYVELLVEGGWLCMQRGAQSMSCRGARAHCVWPRYGVDAAD